MEQIRIAVIGLGYVGLPLALGFARHFPGVVGFDIHKARIDALKEGLDATREVTGEELKSTSLTFSSEVKDIKDANLYIVTVPTPIDADRQPDLTPIRKASETIAGVLKKGDIVVYESTVYPGVTEEECGPLLEKSSGLKQGRDFKLGYSPERINPGDKVHTLENIVKVVAGEDSRTLETLAAVYGKVIKAGIHKAPSIKVAEAAKVIENTQRDINIALMNELSLIFDRLGIRTADVLKAAGTKWNFLPFTPGLVGGHCIGVDPYYLTAKAERLGYHPQVVLAGRRINDSMGSFIAQKLVKMLVEADKKVRRAKVGILGLTFKENVPDVRNSRVPDIVKELAEFGIEAQVHDPNVTAAEARHEYDITLVSEKELTGLDALVVAVPHQQFLKKTVAEVVKAMPEGGIILDVKSAFSPEQFSAYRYWSL